MRRATALCLLASALFVTLISSAGAQTQASFRQLLDGLHARSIGPANPSGRIVELAVVESNPETFYFAAANGGVWKTTNGGKSFEPIFDNYSSIGVGSVAVSQSNPNIVWVGTGEGNIIRSGSWGSGVYKSVDGGKTFQHMGLRESRQNARIVIHPTNPDIVYVAALGHAWGPNSERGLYKTTNGGRSWTKLLGDDENTGCIEVTMDTQNPDILYASLYHYRRDAFSGTSPRIEWGPGSGCFRTEDGGANWTRLSNGFPDGELGRVGFSVYLRDPNIVYAVVQAPTRQQTGTYRSNDRGITWEKVNDFQANPPFFYQQIRVDPNDPETIFLCNVQLTWSTDGGRTLQPVQQRGVHVDHHALWINPKDSNHIILGNDGGVYITKDRAQSWEWVANTPLGQFYAGGYDMAKPYNVMGGVQDNGSWHGPSRTYRSNGILNADWRRVGGGDGFYVWADPTDPNIVYSESQYGALRRYNFAESNQARNIQPRPAQGAERYRFNWNTPLLISHHNPATLYFGGQFLFRSKDRGDNWDTISGDLTRGMPADRNDTGHTITTIDESKLKQGVIWVGTDDGRLHVTLDDGQTWTEVTDNIPGIPTDGWFSRVETSYFDEATAYIAVDRHRNNDVNPYLFKTTDYGKTFTKITGDLPMVNIHSVRQSSKNPNLLFVGTEKGVYATNNGGINWHQFVLPNMPRHAIVHDVQIHPRERELIVATHGRSFYIIDIAPLEETIESDVHLFDVKPAIKFDNSPIDVDPYEFVGENPPYGAVIYYWIDPELNGDRHLVVQDASGREVMVLGLPPTGGLRRAVWDLSDSDGLAASGEYTVTLHVGERKFSKKVQVVDP